MTIIRHPCNGNKSNSFRRNRSERCWQRRLWTPSGIRPPQRKTFKTQTTSLALHGFKFLWQVLRFPYSSLTGIGKVCFLLSQRGTIASRAHKIFTLMTDAEREHQYVFLQSVTDITPFKHQTGEELFLRLIRRWLKFFHENNFGSFTQMHICYRKQLFRNLSLLLTHVLLFCICTAQRKQDV